MISNRPLSRLPLSLSLFSFLSLSLFSNTYSYSKYRRSKSKGAYLHLSPTPEFCNFHKVSGFSTKTHFFFLLPRPKHHSYLFDKMEEEKKCFSVQKHCENSLKPRSGRKCRYAAPLVL
uniref:Uncharacterized protein n=1 Tax=Cacopsylla melanoneura TaxID=428564 RepID=A0A8D8USD4_9HEMI